MDVKQLSYFLLDTSAISIGVRGAGFVLWVQQLYVAGAVRNQLLDVALSTIPL